MKDFSQFSVLGKAVNMTTDIKTTLKEIEYQGSTILSTTSKS